MQKNNTEVMIQMPIQEHKLVAVIVFAISFPGFWLNIIVASFTRKLTTLNNPFGRMMASQASGEAFISGVFAFYFCPMVYFQIDWMKKYSLHPGFILLIAYDICIWSHLFIAVNRLCAICLPLKYDKIFSKRHTFHFIAVSWGIPIATAIILYKLFPCDLYFVEQFWVFGFSQNETCMFIAWYIDFYKDLGIIIAIAAVDLITLYEVHRLTRMQVGQTNAHQVSRRKREVNFFKQVDTMFVIELQCYFIFGWWWPDYRWMVFLLTTVPFNLLHFLDPVIVITLNREFRLFCSSPKKMLTSVLVPEVNANAVGSFSPGTSVQLASTVSPSHPATSQT